MSHSGGDVCSGSGTILPGAYPSNLELSGVPFGDGSALAVMLVVFATRLLNAGQPLHASAPPAPLHCPPPGHEPEECSGTRYDPDGCRALFDVEDSAEGE